MDTEFVQSAHLVLHQRDQGRDDETRAIPDQRRDLVARGFTAAGRHQHKGNATAHDGIDRRRLVFAELSEAKDVSKDLMCGIDHSANARRQTRHDHIPTTDSSSSRFFADIIVSGPAEQSAEPPVGEGPSQKPALPLNANRSFDLEPRDNESRMRTSLRRRMTPLNLPAEHKIIVEAVPIALVAALTFCPPVSAQDAEPEPPQLSIAGVGPDGISIIRSTAEFTHSVTIESGNNTDVDELRISASPFVGPNGARTDIILQTRGETLSPTSSIAVGGLEEIELTLSSRLVESGQFKSSLVMRYAGRRETTALVVTRTLDASSLTITTSGVSTQTLPLFGHSSAGFWVNTEAQGKALNLREPRVKRLVRKHDNMDYASDFEGFTVTRSDNDPIAWPLDIAPATNESLRFSIDGIESPGIFEATLAFSVTDHLPSETIVSFSVRRSAVLAAIVIAAGLLLSMLLQKLKQDIQPRLQQQVDALTLLSRLRRSVKAYRDMRPEDKALVAVFEDRLRDLVARLRLASVADADAVLTELGEKLPMLSRAINLHNRLDSRSGAELRRLKDLLLIAFDKLSAHDSRADAIAAARAALDSAEKAIESAPFDAARQSVTLDLPMDEIDDLHAVAGWKLNDSKWLFDSGILLIALVLGLYLLWSPNMTWGSSADVFIAFLWGLGLHTATAGKPFDGLGSLAGRFETT